MWKRTRVEDVPCSGGPNTHVKSIEAELNEVITERALINWDSRHDGLCQLSSKQLKWTHLNMKRSNIFH